MAATPEPRRNRGFDETHREMIDTAVRLISASAFSAKPVAAKATACSGPGLTG